MNHLYMCVFTAMLMWAYTTWVLLQKAANGYYLLYMITPVEILYCTLGLNSCSWSVGTSELELYNWQESVLVFDPFDWNGIIIISIIINHHHNNNNNNIKNIQMMDTEVIQNTPTLKQTKMKTRYHNQTCFKAVMFGKKAVFVVS